MFLAFGEEVVEECSHPLEGFGWIESWNLNEKAAFNFFFTQFEGGLVLERTNKTGKKLSTSGGRFMWSIELVMSVTPEYFEFFVFET